MASSYYDQVNELRATWNPRDRERVVLSEQFWTDHQKWLQSRGYMLRPRYSPDWVPSWRGTTKFSYSCEDGIPKYVRTCYINSLTFLTFCPALPFDGCYPLVRWNHCGIENDLQIGTSL